MVAQFTSNESTELKSCRYFGKKDGVGRVESMIWNVLGVDAAMSVCAQMCLL